MAARKEPTAAEREVTRKARRVVFALTVLAVGSAVHQQVALGSVQTEVWGFLGLVASFWIGQAGDGVKRWPR